jgi:hypothetical protein
MENEDKDEDREEMRRDEHGARLVYDTGRDTTETSFVLASGDLGGRDVEGRLGRDVTRLVDRPEGRDVARLVDDVGRDDTRDEHDARLDQRQGDETRRDARLVFSFISDSDRPSSRSRRNDNAGAWTCGPMAHEFAIVDCVDDREETRPSPVPKPRCSPTRRVSS